MEQKCYTHNICQSLINVCFYLWRLTTFTFQMIDTRIDLYYETKVKPILSKLQGSQIRSRPFFTPPTARSTGWLRLFLQLTQVKKKV